MFLSVFLKLKLEGLWTDNRLFTSKSFFCREHWTLAGQAGADPGIFDWGGGGGGLQLLGQKGLLNFFEANYLLSSVAKMQRVFHKKNLVS